MTKQIIYEQNARMQLLLGVDQIANAVAVTLGPKGRNVAISNVYGMPVITHDGVTVAEQIDLPNSFQNMGAQFIKEAASKTNLTSGDGTTTAAVLTQAMVHEGMKNLAAGANAMRMKMGIAAALEAVSDHIMEQAVLLKIRETIAQVASISAQDSRIGELIATAMDKVGQNGVITVEDSNTLHDELEYVEGMQFDRGYISPYFVMNNNEMSAVLEDPYVLIYDKRINAIDEILPLLDKLVLSGKREMVIIAEDVSSEVLSLMVLNTLRSTVALLAVKAPGFGAQRQEMLRDLAVLTGTTVISMDTGGSLEKISLEELGHATKVTSTKDHTTIINGAGSTDAILAHIRGIKREIELSTSEYDREKLESRVAKLGSGVAVIKVGAATETELKEKKQRVEDALNATRAAVEKGIVPGGGVTLMNAAAALVDLKFDDDDINTGVQVVRKALEAPMRQLVENAGQEGAVIIDNVRRIQLQMGNSRIGYNVMTNEYVDMITSGIPDPAKVTLGAIESAASIASMILSIEALVVDQPAGMAASARMN